MRTLNMYQGVTLAPTLGNLLCAGLVLKTASERSANRDRLRQTTRHTRNDRPRRELRLTECSAVVIGAPGGSRRDALLRHRLCVVWAGRGADQQVRGRLSVHEGPRAAKMFKPVGGKRTQHVIEQRIFRFGPFDIRRGSVFRYRYLFDRGKVPLPLVVTSDRMYVLAKGLPSSSSDSEARSQACCRAKRRASTCRRRSSCSRATRTIFWYLYVR